MRVEGAVFIAFVPRLRLYLLRNENPLVIVCTPYALRSEYYRQGHAPPQGNDVANATVSLVADDERPVQQKVTGSQGMAV